MRVWVSLLAQVLIMIVFFLTYTTFYYAGVAKFNKDMNVMDLMHFSVITQSTVGYGDLYPVNAGARVISWLHIFTTVTVIAYTTLGDDFPALLR